MRSSPAAVTQQTFVVHGNLLLRRKGLYDDPIPNREFRAHFGASLNVCFNLWAQCEDSYFRQNVSPMHHMWGLLFLKLYTTEDVLAVIAGVTRKTFRRWAWLVAETIAKRKNVLVCPCFNVLIAPYTSIHILSFFLFLYLVHFLTVFLGIDGTSSMSFYVKYVRSDWTIDSETTEVRHVK